MLHSWTLSGAAVALLLLIVFCSPTTASAGNLIDFVNPQPGAFLSGPTEFQFAVKDPGAGVERIDVFAAGRLLGTALPPVWKFQADISSDLAQSKITAVAFVHGKPAEKVPLPSAEILGQEVSVTAIQLFPVVFDGHHRYIGNLTQDDFAVLESGTPVKIDYFAKEVLSLTLAFVLDNSGSMDDTLGLVQESSCRFIDQLKADDQVAVYGFNYKLMNMHAATADHNAAKVAIRQMTAGGGTALYDAVAQVLSDLKPVLGRKAIILFSDGQDNRSLLPLSKVVQMAREADVIVYAIASGEEKNDLAARVDLKMLAEETGGEPLVLTGVKSLPKIYEEIFADLRSQYSISYQPPSGPAGVRSVEVRVRNPKYRVRCRKTYKYEAG